MPIDNPTWEQTTEDQAPSWEDTTEDIAAPAFRPVPPGAIEANINPYERARRILPPGRMTPFGPENPAEILAIPQIAAIPGAIATKVEEAVPELGTIRNIYSPRSVLEKGTEALHEAVAPAVSEFLVRSGIDPSSTPERVINLPRIPAEAFPSIPGLPSPEVAAGVTRLAAGTTEMLAQPENAILALASGGETIVSRAAALMFAAEQFRNLPAELQEAVRVVADPKATIPEKIEAAGRPGVNALLTAGMARAGTRPLPRIRPPVETSGGFIPQINLEQPPLALYGSELAGRPRGAVPVQPIAGSEVLGPPAPRRVRAPEIPAAGTAERLTQEQQVREANARTKEQIRALFPDLSREEAAMLRDRAWGVAGETGVFPGEMATLRSQIPEAVRRRFFRTEGEETLEGLRALAGLPGRRVAAPPAPAADLPADAAAQFAKETGWTVTRGQAGAGVKMPTAAELEKLPESERALYQQMADAQGAPVEYTDRRPGSPTQGFTFYAPKDASLADIRAAHAAKLAGVKAAQKPATTKPEMALLGPESNAEVKDAHGNPLGTYYYGTADDWLAWKNLQKQKAAALAAQDMGALEKLLLENERIKNLYGGNPPLPPKGTKIVAAAYFPKGATAPETGPNHPAILKRLGVSGFETPESRNTPEFGYVLSDGSFITREEAGPISKASKQNLVDFDAGENVHSDEVASPTEPDKPLGEAKPADIGARVVAGKTLAEWEAVKDASGLPKGKSLSELAQFLAVPAKPGRVLAALANKNRTREIHAPPPAIPPPAPPQEPPAAAPVPVPKPPPAPAAPAAAAETPPPPAAPEIPPGELLAVPPVAIPTANQQRSQIVRLLEQLEEEDNLGEISMRELETDAWEEMSKAIASTLGRSWGDVLNMEQEAAIKALRARLGEIEKAKREGREPSAVPPAPPQPANATLARIQSAFDDWDAGKEGANSVDLLDKVENEISDFPDNVPPALQDAARKYREAVEESYEEGAKLEGAFIAEVAKASGRPVPKDVLAQSSAKPPELMTEEEFDAWEQQQPYTGRAFVPASDNESGGALTGFAAEAWRARKAGKPISEDARRVLDQEIASNQQFARESAQRGEDYLSRIKGRKVELPEAQFEKLHDTYWGDKKNPTKAFAFEGKAYVSTGGSFYPGLQITNAWELIPAAEWKGPSYTQAELYAKWDRGESERGDDTGLKVTLRGKPFVLANRIVFFNRPPLPYGRSTPSAPPETKPAAPATPAAIPETKPAPVPESGFVERIANDPQVDDVVQHPDFGRVMVTQVAPDKIRFQIQEGSKKGKYASLPRKEWTEDLTGKIQAPEPATAKGYSDYGGDAFDVDRLARILGMAQDDWKAQPLYLRNSQMASYLADKSSLLALEDAIDAKDFKTVESLFQNSLPPDHNIRKLFQALTKAKNPGQWEGALQSESSTAAGDRDLAQQIDVALQRQLQGQKPPPPAPAAASAPPISQAPITEASAVTDLRPALRGAKIPPDLQAMIDRRNQLREQMDAQILKIEGNKARGAKAEPNSAEWKAAYKEAQEIDAQTDKIRGELAPLEAKVWDQLWEMEKAAVRGLPVPPPRTPQVTAKVLKAQRENLLSQLDEAIKAAPESGEEKIQISVPGDGDFTLNNHKAALRKFKGIVQKEFPTAVPTGKGPSVPSGKARALPKVAEPAANELPKIVGAFVSQDQSRFVLQTMYADGTQIIATDGRRLMRVVTAAAPGTPAEPVRVTPEGKIDVDANESNFPNYNVVKPTDPTLVKGGFNIEDLWKIGRQAQALLKDGKTDAVSLYLNKDGTFGGKASNAGVGDFEHNVQPDAFFLGNVNADYLVEGLEAGRRLGNEKLDLYVEGDAGPFVFVGKNHDYTLMGMKPEGMPEGVARDDPKKLRPAAVGQKVFALQPAGLGPLKNPEAPNSQMIGTDQGNFQITYKNGELSVEKVPVVSRGYAVPIDAGTYTIDKTKAVAPTVQEIQAKSGDFLEQKFTVKTLNALRKGMESLLKEREALIEEGKTRMAASKPSLGPGAAAAAEFSDGPPDHEVLGQQIGSPAWNRITRLFRNFFLGFEQLYERGGQKTDLMMLANAADNLPRIAGLNAGEKLRLRTSADQRQAITFVMQSLKMSGEGIPAEAAERLGQLEFAGDPIGYLRAKQADMETAAQAFNNRGEKIEAKAALDAAKAMFFARQHFNELRPLADLAKRIFDSQLMRERISGIDTDYERWYVPQRHELDLITSTDRPIVLGHSRAGGLSSAFKKAKVYEDYASAIEDGFVPRSLDIADLVEHRVNQGERLVSRKAFFNKMRQMTDPVDGKALAIKIPRKIIHRPDGSFDVQESVPLGYRMQDVIPGVRIAVHDGYARLIRAMTASSQIADSAAIGTLQDIAAFEKHIGLALDTFHASRTMQAELALTGKVSIGARQRLGRALVEYSASDLDAAVSKGEITQEMADWIRRPQPMEVNGRQISLTPKSVFTLGLNNGLNVARFADAIYRDWLRKVPISGTVNKWVFDKMTRSAIAHGFIVEFERVAKANPQLDATRVARNVARDINVMFGNLQKESIFRNPSLRSINQILFLAPTWVEALARREARFGIQMAKLPLQLARGEPLSVGTVGRGVGTGLAAYFVATQVLNLITRHQLTFYNDERGHKLDAWIPDVTGKTGGFFISPLSVFAEITHDILRYAETKPDLATALQQIGTNKLGNLGRFMEVVALGRDPLSGDKIIGTGRRALTAAIQAVPVPISLSQLSRGAAAAAAPGLVTPPPAGAIQRQVTASMGFKTEPVPTAGQQIYQLADKWKSESGDPKLVDDVTRRLQQDFGPSDYKPLRNALQAGDLAGARRAYDELRKSKNAEQIRQTMQHPHPFTGSAANERRFKASLTPAEREIYDKALQERRELYRRYRQMLYSNR